jgi:hypothetical protein
MRKGMFEHLRKCPFNIFEKASNQLKKLKIEKINFHYYFEKRGVLNFGFQINMLENSEFP